MKKLPVAMLALLLILTACTAGGTQTEETAVPSTETSLEAAPTATDEPPATAEPTATDEPEPTETAEPNATVVPPKEVETPNYEGIIPDDVELPDGAVVVYTQTGGFAGFNDTWVFYEDGRVTLNGEEKTQLTAERIDQLVSDLDAHNFFETVQITKPGEFCCDFFSYTLAVQTADKRNFVSFSEGDPNLPASLWEVLSLMRDITNEANLR